MDVFGVILLVIIIIFIIIIIIYEVTQVPIVTNLDLSVNYLCNDGNCTTKFSFTAHTYTDMEVRRERADGSLSTVLLRAKPDLGTPLEGQLSDQTERDGTHFVMTLHANNILSGTSRLVVYATRDANMTNVTRSAEITKGNYITEDIQFAEQIGKVYATGDTEQQMPIGVEKFEYERTFSSAAMDTQGIYRVCGLAGLARIAVSNVNVAFDTKYPNLYPDTDATREHPEEVHVRIFRGEDTILEQTFSNDTTHVFTPAIDIEGNELLTLYAMMHSGEEGSYQEGYWVTWNLEFELTCPT